MIKSIIRDMFNNTDDKGLLYMNGWNIDISETGCVPRFYRFTMNWDLDKAKKIADEAQELCDALETLGRYFADNELDIQTKPEPGQLGGRQEAERLLEVWEMLFDGYEEDGIDKSELVELAQQRLGGNEFACNAFIRAGYIVKTVSWGVLQFYIDTQKYEFASAYALAHACDDFVCIDITKDSYDSKTHKFGEFDESDMCRVFDIIENDCTVIPNESMGCTLLVNKIFCIRRLDIYRNSELKPTVEVMLKTLSKSEQEIMKCLYGIDNGERKTYAQAARETGSPVTVVKYYEALALKNLLKLAAVICKKLNNGK